MVGVALPLCDRLLLSFIFSICSVCGSSSILPSIAVFLCDIAMSEVGDEDWFEDSTTFNNGVSQLSGHRNQCNKPVPPPKCDKVMNLKITGDSVSQSNIVCDYVTFGAMLRLCNKQDALGQTKHLTRKEMRFYDSRLNPLRFWTRRARDHSLLSFQNAA